MSADSLHLIQATKRAAGLDFMQRSHLSVTWRLNGSRHGEQTGEGRAATEQELYPVSLVCCCPSLAASPFIWKISARIRLLYNLKYVLHFLQIKVLTLIPKSKLFL